METALNSSAHPTPTLQQLERFLAKTSPEPNSGCWLWVGAVQLNGYGRLTANKRPMLAHRRAWELYRGPVDYGLHVLHKCDVRCCVNPDHLFLGTNTDNCRDALAKGRQYPANRKTCPNGHAYDARWGGQRACRTCYNARKRELYAARHHSTKEN